MSEEQVSVSAGNPRTDNGLDMKTLFVRSIPFDVTDEELGRFFSNFAPTKHAVVVKDVNKKSRGFGFVSFATEEDTKDALGKARRLKLNGNVLRVDIAKRRDRNKKNGEEKAKSLPLNTISDREVEQSDDEEEDSQLKGKPKLIIRNMPWSCRDPNKLMKIFGRFGNVVEASIPRKRDGKLCGFAFVTMKKISNCRLALENTKDLKIDGRNVAVDFAVQKNRWEDHMKKDDEEKESAKDESSEEESADEAASEEKQAEDKIQLNSDEEISVEEDDNEEEEEPKRVQKNRKEDYSVFVRNVPYDATKESLVDHFSKFGPVKYALPVIDRETGLAKGTAFIAFRNEETYKSCLENAPAAGSTSLLIGDDVLPEYVYEGRVLSVSPTLVREEANKRAEKSAEKRKEILGKAPGERDKRNLYLLNEGRVVEGTKMAELLPAKDMEIREKSYSLRVEQLKKNPSLHLSLTRLAIRNLPRAMTEKALKALARKAVVEFAKEVKDNKRHPLSQEEIVRSTKEKYRFMSPEEIAKQKKRDKKHGIVKQAKVIMEVKGSSIGRSRGYGFVEYKDHKHALMGLRWLNVHAVAPEEVLEGLTEEEQKSIDPSSVKGRRLCVEFALDNANVVKRRRENIKQAREGFKRGRDDNETEGDAALNAKKAKTQNENDNDNDNDGKDGKNLSNDIKRLIGLKRKRKQTRR